MPSRYSTVSSARRASRTHEPRVRRVAVLIEMDDTWGREVVQAVARYARTAHWGLLINPRDGQYRLRLPPRWRGDGAVVSLIDRLTLRHVRAAGVPAVDVAIRYPEERWLGRIATCNHARVRVAFEHFRERQFEHFACYGPSIVRYTDERSRFFRDVVEKAGFKCSEFVPAKRPRCGLDVDFREVGRWLKSLPRPVAVLAPDSYPARQLVDICRLEGVHVPHDVAIVSGDSDELLCCLSSPGLSSVEPASARIALEACRLLARMMEGDPPPQEPVLIPPVRVVPRQSTDVLAIDDPEIAPILRYIRDHAAEGIRVSDICRTFPISRRRLEQRFRLLVGRAPAEEIRRYRLHCARDLLLDTDLTVSAIAASTGMCSGAALANAFRKYLGVAPSRLRAAQRNRCR